MNCIIFFSWYRIIELKKKCLKTDIFLNLNYIFFYYLPVGLDIRQTQV